MVHVGDFKTGSTSIQVALDRGLVRAPGQRLLFPGRTDHRPLAQSLSPAEAGHRQARWSDLARQLEAPDWDLAVISSEQFEFYPPERLAEALAEFVPGLAGTARIVMYLRPHAPRLVSNWAEALKQGFTDGPAETTYDTLLRQRRLFYAGRVARWRAVFGPRLTVRPMIRSELWRSDVVADFFRIAFESDALEFDPLPPQNPRLSMPDLSLLREVHLALRARDPALAGAGHAFAWEFARFLAARPLPEGPARGAAPSPDSNPALHRTLARRMLEDYGDDAGRVDADIFGRPLFLPALTGAVEAALDQPQQVTAEAWHDPQTIRQTRAWAAMLAEVLAAGPVPLLTALQQRQGAP